MQEIKKLLNLPKHDYYRTHLSIINCILPQHLTQMEINVLAAFMGLEGDIAKYRFGTSAKKLVMEQLGLKPAGLSNYIAALIKKQFLFEEEDNKNLNILPILFPERDQQMYRFKLINNN